jgi:hypothetical protein
MASIEAGSNDFYEEIGYRNGYTDAVKDVIRHFYARLSESDQATLVEWRSKLMEWRGPTGVLNQQKSLDFIPPPSAIDEIDTKQQAN